MLSQSSLNTVQQTRTLMSGSLRRATESLPAAVSDWSENDVGNFLDNIGLHEYSPAFVHERVRGVTLADLTMEDVFALGVHRLGDRKFLFKALEHVLAEDEAHHSAHVPLIPNSNTRTRYVPRNLKTPLLPPSGKVVSTSFDALARQRRISDAENSFNRTADSLLVEEDEEGLEPVQVIIKKKAVKKVTKPRNVAPVNIEFTNIDPFDVPRNNKRRMSGPPAIDTSTVAAPPPSDPVPTSPQYKLVSSMVQHATASAVNSQSSTSKKRKKADDRSQLTISPEIMPPSFDPAPPPLVDEEIQSSSEDDHDVVPENGPLPSSLGTLAQFPPGLPTQVPHPGILHSSKANVPVAKTVKFEELVEVR